MSVACGSDAGGNGRGDVSSVQPIERGANDRAAGTTNLPEPLADTPDFGAVSDDAAPVPSPGEALPLEWPTRASPLRRLLLAGTWSPDPDQGFDRAWIDEAGLRETFSLRNAGRRRWQGVNGGETLVNLDALTRSRPDPALAYVYSVSSRPNTGNIDPFAEDAFPPAEAVLHIRHSGRLRAWWDGEVVLNETAPADGKLQHVQARVMLTDAYDVLLLKLARGQDYGPSMNFEVRLSDPFGGAIPGQEFVPRRKNEMPSELSENR